MATVKNHLMNMISGLYIVTLFIVLLSCVELLMVECAPTLTTPCGVDQFRDISGMCEFCSVVCDNPLVQDTLLKCLTNCPGFLKTTITPDTSAHTTTTTSTPPVSPPDQPLAIHIVVGVVVVFVIFCIIATAAVMKRKILVTWILYRCKRIHEKYPIQEVADAGGSADVAEPDGGAETVPEDGPRPDECLINSSSDS